MLILRMQLEPNEYYFFRLYLRDVKKKHVLDYLNSAQYTRDISPVLNPPEWHYILNDKLFCNLHFRNAGIPVARQYGFYSRDVGYLAGGGQLSTPRDFLDFILNEKPDSLALKPHNTFGGYGIMIFQRIEYAAEVLFKSSNGTEITLKNLSEKLQHVLDTDKNIQGFVLESVVDQHPVLAEIYPHSVNTLRILTYLTRDRQARVLGTRIRLGRNGSLTDNISQGGIHASVDKETGRIKNGFWMKSGIETTLGTHPDTGTVFKGMEIPFWQDILELCRKAATETPFQRFIGWDIAVGKSGPVLIEGNSTGVEVVYDQFDGRGFMTDEFRNDMLAYGIRFPERLPGISLRKIYQSYKISRRMNKIDY